MDGLLLTIQMLVYFFHFYLYKPSYFNEKSYIISQNPNKTHWLNFLLMDKSNLISSKLLVFWPQEIG